jgi:uncharacterized membrane protein YhhN
MIVNIVCFLAESVHGTLLCMIDGRWVFNVGLAYYESFYGRLLYTRKSLSLRSRVACDHNKNPSVVG